MPRAPLLVLVIPYRQTPSGHQFALFRRSDDDAWQWISGGAEDGETAHQAAAREMAEEAGIPADTPLLPLDAHATVPACHFTARDHWGPAVLVVPEHSFAVHVPHDQITLSPEHAESRWLPYDAAMSLLRWDSNRTALRELNQRLSRP